MRNLIFFIIWTFLYSGMTTGTQAAIFVKKNTGMATLPASTSPCNIHHLSFWEQVHSYRRVLANDSHIPGQKNRNGILSLSFIGFLLLALAAVTIITPTIPSGLGALLYVSSLGTSVLAIVFGSIGLRKDHKRGFARAGLILGIVILSIVLLMSLLLLTVTGTIAF